MFDQMLDSRRIGVAAQSPWSLPIAALLHFALIGGLLSASYWIVRGIEEPRFPLVLLRVAPVPQPPAEPPGAAAAPAARSEAQKPERPEPQVLEETVQPIDTPDILIEDTLGAGENPGSGDGSGTTDAASPGVQGGVIDGTGDRLGGNGTDGPLVPGGNVTNPELIAESKVQPEYPEVARVTRTQGTVILRAVIQSDGTVGEIEVLRCDHPRLGFEDAAVGAVKQWRYRPATQLGGPVAVYFTIVVEFRLN